MATIRILGVAALIACGAVFTSCARTQTASDQPRPRTHTVRMEGMVFSPAVLTVKAGDTVVWVNKDLVPHSATSTSADFDSKVVTATNSWRHRLEKTGDFDYVCSFHPTMTGKLTVQ